MTAKTKIVVKDNELQIDLPDTPEKPGVIYGITIRQSDEKDKRGKPVGFFAAGMPVLTTFGDNSRLYQIIQLTFGAKIAQDRFLTVLTNPSSVEWIDSRNF